MATIHKVGQALGMIKSRIKEYKHDEKSLNKILDELWGVLATLELEKIATNKRRRMKK